jgi:site-specific DNA-methyltransferase (adenine-specific)
MCFNPQFRKGKPYTCKNGRASSNYDEKNYEQVITVNDGNYYPISILEFAPETGLHPTQKPLSLLEYLVSTYSNENDIVFDPFMGSGTTGKMAILNNRNFIGIEKEENYFAISDKRIKEAQENYQPDLFKVAL